MKSRVAAFAVAAALCAMPALAQPTPDGWIADARSSCRVHDPVPQPTETIQWEGQCRNGLVEGKGVLHWLQDGVEDERDEGEWHGGKLNGHAIIIFTSGGYFDGQFSNDKANGYGLFVDDDGSKYAGMWKDGCYSQGGRRAMFSTTWAKCGFPGKEPE